MEDFYELLGVSEDAGTDEIDRAWRERVRRYHPDVNDDARANAQFKTLQTAHEVLTDDTERAAYDRLGHETYVRERLDGLPTAGRPDDGDTDAEFAGSGGDGSGADAGGSGPGGAGGGGRTDRAGRADRTTGSPGAGSGRGGTGRRRGTDARGRTAGTARGAGGSNDRAGTRATPTAGRRSRPRRPLTYGWAGIATAGLVYCLGLWAYLGANAEALSTLAAASPSTLPSVLVRARTLVAPGAFVLEAVSAGAVLPLALAAGAAGIAVGFVAVVASFGRGAAYLYAVGGLTPVAALAIGPVVAVPDGVILGLAVVAPVATVGLFLVDVGRELLADR
jgi:curved DNA-binding protein CbpA